MKIWLLFIFFCFNVSSQDSLWEGKSFDLPELRYPTCVSWGNNWADEEFDRHYGLFFDSLASFISSNNQAKLEIRVHSDSRGSDSLNLALTQHRADDLVSRLVARGVDPNQVEAIGIGEMFPRKVWLRDSTYYVSDPNDPAAIPVFLTDEYINSFKTERERFELLHQFNRHSLMIVSNVDFDKQREINHELYLRKLYNGHQVEAITAGLIEHQDTLVIMNEGDLFLHLVAPGTENEFTIRSLERDEVYSYNKWRTGIEEIVDFRKAKGLYEIKVFGDGGSGSMILVVYNSIKLE